MIDVDRVTELYPGNALMEKDNDGNWTGRWYCVKCWKKYDPNSNDNIMKSMRNRRIGNQDPNHSNAKGDKIQELACLEFGWIDLNIVNDNYKSPVDLIDSKTGFKHQVKGKWYNSRYRYWDFGNIEGKWFKEFKDMVCYCISEDGNDVERIYIFIEEEVKKRTCIVITKNPMNSRGTIVL